MSFIDDIGGPAVVDRLADRFYTRVLSDPLLRPLFRDPDEDHAGRMAWFLTELFGGEPLHSERRGGFSTMVAAHRGLKITGTPAGVGALVRGDAVEGAVAGVGEVRFRLI